MLFCPILHSQGDVSSFPCDVGAVPDQQPLGPLDHNSSQPILEEEPLFAYFVCFIFMIVGRRVLYI